MWDRVCVDEGYIGLISVIFTLYVTPSLAVLSVFYLMSYDWLVIIMIVTMDWWRWRYYIHRLSFDGLVEWNYVWKSLGRLSPINPPPLGEPPTAASSHQNMDSCLMASLRLVSPGAATDGLTIFFP